MSEKLYKRYFLVFYTFMGGNKTGYGHTTMTTESTQEGGSYLNSDKTNKIIIDILSKTEYKESTPVVTGVQEISESDYKDWIQKHEPIDESEEDSPLMIDVELSEDALKEVEIKFNEGWDEDEIVDHLIFEKMRPTPKTTDDEMKFLVQVAIKKIVTGE